LTLGVVLAVASTASASIVITDDFENPPYATTADLDPPWALAVGTVADSFLDTTMNGPSAPGTQSVHHTAVGARRDRSDFTPFQVTGTAIWRFDYYDFVGSASDPRQYGQLLSQASGGGLSELLAMGQYNNAAPVHDSTKYQARVAFSGVGWINLNTTRSVGWHTFEARIGATTVDFYVDGVADTLNLPHNGFEWYQARIGSGLSSAGGDAAYDNYLLTPEPGSLALLVLGGLPLIRRRQSARS
jgi:MYXO-CTERM domain-containing protein